VGVESAEALTELQATPSTGKRLEKPEVSMVEKFFSSIRLMRKKR